MRFRAGFLYALKPPLPRHQPHEGDQCPQTQPDDAYTPSHFHISRNPNPIPDSVHHSQGAAVCIVEIIEIKSCAGFRYLRHPLRPRLFEVIEECGVALSNLSTRTVRESSRFLRLPTLAQNIASMWLIHCGT